MPLGFAVLPMWCSRICRLRISEDDADFAAAFERASKAGKPALIELRIDPEAITPAATLSGLRAKALAK